MRAATTTSPAKSQRVLIPTASSMMATSNSQLRARPNVAKQPMIIASERLGKAGSEGWSPNHNINLIFHLYSQKEEKIIVN